MNEIQLAEERKLSKHNRYYQKTQTEQKAKALSYYHSKGKAQRKMRNDTAKEHSTPMLEETIVDGDGEANCDSDTADNSDASWSDNIAEDSDGGSSDGWYDSDASVEGGLLNVDTTFLKNYRSGYWVHDEDDTIEYRVRSLEEDLGLWLGRWGGVSNWEVISANPERESQIKEQMELGIQYATLMRQVWGARAREDMVESKEVEMYWERTGKLMTRLYDALSLLGTHMDWD